MKTLIDDIWISVRTYNVLKRAGIETLEDLTNPKNWRKILNQNGCGKNTIIDISAAIMNAASGQLLEDAKVLEKASLRLEDAKVLEKASLRLLCKDCGNDIHRNFRCKCGGNPWFIKKPRFLKKHL